MNAESMGNASFERQPRIATVCVLDPSGHSPNYNDATARILTDVVKGFKQQPWSGVDCLVFPGALFYVPGYMGNLPYEERVKVLETAVFSNTLKNACGELQEHNPGLLLVAGVDGSNSHPDGQDYGHDQLCVAWTPTGIAGIGRKVFPAPADALFLISYASDFASSHRVLDLPSGNKAILCSCYDLFGCSESLEHRTKRTTNILCIEEDGIRYKNDHPEFTTRRDRCLSSWHSLLVSHKVNVGITAIHFFQRPGLDLFWQRHGIATCSAVLGGGMAVGAAFFERKLPSPNSSSLVSAGVPLSHLGEGLHRKAQRLTPAGFFEVKGALVRLF